jgi:thiol-disulfide isomerase/thioredoxin
VKLKNIILLGVIVCLYSFIFAASAPAKTFDVAAANWITPNPPTSEDICGRVCVVEFWATWCPPCRDQVPHMKMLAKQYEDLNVFFMGISEDQSIGDVRKFVEKKSINYHIGMDNGLADRFGVSGIPKAFVISHEGKVLWSGHPADSRFEETLSSAVKAAPRPMLAGVQMGRFGYLRARLCGGKNFAKAYAEIETCAGRCNCSEKNCACGVYAAVNAKLREKIATAEQMRDKNPQAALAIYKDLIDNYGGINLTKEIERVYLELKRETAAQADKKPVAKAG